MISALVAYIGRNGKTIVKGFASVRDAEVFCEKLDKRIENGTCGGYLMSVM